MVDEFLAVMGRASSGDSHVEGVEIGLCEHTPGCVVTDDLPRVQVFDERDITEYPSDREVKDVAGPDLVDIAKSGTVQKVGNEVMRLRISGFVKFSLRKRLVAVRHAILKESISTREIRAEFVVYLLQGHGRVLLALLRQRCRKEGKTILLLLAAPHRQPMSLLGGASYLVQGAHWAGAL